ncbi:uncharacterized protein Tco025E_06246 [Trypanosoma conorhini]|uniref:Uncharacterized protein n=1 Tax=Trypanosoma conorhini TaxID=83891 RepID=A0A3R7NX67_9TRYP|nr:uncharacterized protein Tco025E_06246 [Trypanosoma conorhini]RNF13265.1 hypothetical protein Tco025E_06246 [Trypanosoma conorhini]
MMFASCQLWRFRRSVVLPLMRANRGVLAAAAIKDSNQQPTNAAGDGGKDEDGTLLRPSAGEASRRVRSRRRDARSRKGGEPKNSVPCPLHDGGKESPAAMRLSPTLAAGAVDPAPTPVAYSEEASSVALSLQAHRRLAAETERHRVQASESVASGAVHAAHERIERRRKKWSLTEVEFDVGITERLFPEIRRLPALHELHYGDALMREVDAVSYFAAKQGADGSEKSEMDDKVAEVPLTDADFLAFAEQELQQQPTPAAASASSALLPALGGRTGDLPPAEEEQQGRLSQESSSGALASEDRVVVHGIQTPWFVPDGGVVRLEPLPSSDALCLLRFVLHLRQQTPQHLPLAVQKRMKKAEALQTAPVNDKKYIEKPLSLEDVMVYLDTAPPPILGFTENLPPTKSPAFVFVLYTENVSLQNAVGHMAALFNIPQRAFHTCTAVSKMSCGAVLCAVSPNQVEREHLLLLNTMRHPGFVLRLGSIRAVEDETASATLFSELSRWQPLNEVELLLRRVSCGGRQELEHRLRAVQEVGAVFFCANREASLVRAATDVLHGFFKSALLNALHRRNAPMAVRHFLARPNLITAARARRASTDATVRQVLKNYILVGGDWQKTVARTPYVWRRRWLNALRCSVWNMMASRRLRCGGRRVLPGDVVLRPDYRADAHRRMLTTVKAEHVMLVADEAAAAQCSVEDVFIPFLRGVYPPEFFAPEATQHPIMTQASMLALLREAHAPQLLLGMSDACRLLLDIRSESSPLLFRRLIIRPIEMSFSILEDKPPMKSIHFDAARMLESDRLRLQRPSLPGISREEKALQSSAGVANQLTLRPSLLPQSLVLERSTIGARLASGLLAEEFFAPPARDEYVVLGHVERHLSGNLVLAAPRADDEALKTIDRLFTIHVHAVVRNGLAAVGHLLREYFILAGVEREEDSALQHKIHRVRRELDSETPRLTSPTFCQACYCRDHDALESCAEYQIKRSKHESVKRRAEVLQELANADTSALMPPAATNGIELTENAVAPVEQTETEVVLELELRLRRRSEEQKWGIYLTAALQLSDIEDVSVLSEGRIRCVAAAALQTASQKDFWETFLRQQQENGGATSQGDEAGSQWVALSHFILKATGATGSLLRAGDDGPSLPNTNASEGLPLPQLRDAFPPPRPRLPDGDVGTGPTSMAEAVKSRKLLRQCKWVLTSINDTTVTGRRQVAAVFVRLGKAREVTLRLSATLQGCSGLCPPCRNAAETLPPTIELTLMRAGTDEGGWGLKFDCDSLTLLNLAQLLHAHGSSGVTALVEPPFLTTLAGAATVDGKYALSRVNGEEVGTQRDVLERLRRIKGRGKEKKLWLQLVLRSQGSKGEDTRQPASEAAAVMSCPPAVGIVEGGSGEHSGVSSLEGGADEADGEDKGEAAAAAAADSPPCSPQCTPLTPEQRKRSVVTIVVNRRADAPPGRWGIRVRRGTLRLQRLQSNHAFSFQVYAAKRQQAVRVADTLRFNNARQQDGKQGDAATGVALVTTATEVAFYSHFVYLIVGVNHRQVASCEELRASLAAAASSADESVVLQVQQYRLAQIAVHILRGDGDGEAALESVGFRISREMVIESVEAGGPMARAILAATHDGCSLRRLINSSCPPTATGDGATEGCGVAKPSAPPSSVSTGTRCKFDLDEDAPEQAGGPSTSVAVAATARTTGAPCSSAPPAYWNMVDGVALMSLCGEGDATRFVWRVSYGVRAGPLRTPQDLARALAADVREETLFLQQCLLDD